MGIGAQVGEIFWLLLGVSTTDGENKSKPIGSFRARPFFELL